MAGRVVAGLTFEERVRRGRILLSGGHPAGYEQNRKSNGQFDVGDGAQKAQSPEERKAAAAKARAQKAAATRARKKAEAAQAKAKAQADRTVEEMHARTREGAKASKGEESPWDAAQHERDNAKTITDARRLARQNGARLPSTRAVMPTAEQKTQIEGRIETHLRSGMRVMEADQRATNEVMGPVRAAREREHAAVMRDLAAKAETPADSAVYRRAADVHEQLAARADAESGRDSGVFKAQHEALTAEYERLAAKFATDIHGENRRQTYRAATDLHKRVYDLQRGAESRMHEAMDREDAAKTPEETRKAGEDFSKAKAERDQASALWSTVQDLGAAARNNPETTERWLTAYRARGEAEKASAKASKASTRATARPLSGEEPQDGFRAKTLEALKAERAGGETAREGATREELLAKAEEHERRAQMARTAADSARAGAELERTRAEAIPDPTYRKTAEARLATHEREIGTYMRQAMAHDLEAFQARAEAEKLAPSKAEEAAKPAAEESAAKAAKGAKAGEVQHVPAAMVHVGLNPREYFDPEKVQELAASIKEHGLLQPISVREHEGGYQIIAGERRFRALQALGEKNIPVIVHNVGDQQARELALIENVNREDMRPGETARAYQRMLDSGMSVKDLAGKLGKTPASVQQHLDLLALHPHVQQAIDEGRLSLSLAKDLAKLDHGTQLEATEHILSHDLGAKSARSYLKTRVAMSNQMDLFPEVHTATPKELEAKGRYETAMEHVTRTLAGLDDETVGHYARVVDSPAREVERLKLIAKQVKRMQTALEQETHRRTITGQTVKASERLARLALRVRRTVRLGQTLRECAVACREEVAAVRRLSERAARDERVRRGQILLLAEARAKRASKAGTTTRVRAWRNVDLRGVRVLLDERGGNGATATLERTSPGEHTAGQQPEGGMTGTDGRPRSWIMFAPLGHFEHPRYGKLNFTRAKLTEMKRHFDAHTRKIDLALDKDHDQGAATGWVERMELRDAGADGQPAGLYALVRWTPHGQQLLRDEIYRYFSPEFGPWEDPATGTHHDNVPMGGALTNRPFLKVLPPVSLSEGARVRVSTRPWSQVDKSRLPRACFLDQGEPGHPSTWRLPIYEGAGPTVAGRYSKRGALNIHAVRAALAAVGGARSGKPMVGLPAGTTVKLERLLQRYGTTDD